METVDAVKNKNFRFGAIILVIVFFAVLNEMVYIFSHRDVLSSYILKSASFVILKGNINLGIFILTEGRVKKVTETQFRQETENYIKQNKSNYDIARVNYDLAIIAAKHGLTDIVPRFLETSINRDPDFSFWRVELVNYYLSMGMNDQAMVALRDCLDNPIPSQHCRDYNNSDFESKKVYAVGFLEDEIKLIYQTKSF